MRLTRELFDAIFKRDEQPLPPIAKRLGPTAILEAESKAPDASVEQLEHALETLKAEGKRPPFRLELDASDWQKEAIRNWCKKQDGLAVTVHRADGKKRRVL